MAMKIYQKSYMGAAAVAHLNLSMAIANPLEWSLSSANRTTFHFSKHFHSSIQTRPPYPLINLNSRIARADSACSPPALEEHQSIDNAPVIELALKLQNFQPADHLPDDSRELNALICSLFRDYGTLTLAYDYYQKAKEKQGFIPQRYTLKLLVKYFIHAKNWKSLFSFCQDLGDFQVLPDKATCSRLVTACIKARKLKLVNNLVDVFLSIDVETAVLAFGCSMKGCNQLHMYSSSVVYYQMMKSSGLDLDLSCYSHIMEANLKMGHYEKAIELFHELENRNLIQTGHHSSPLCSRIYWILCECLGKIGRAFEALEYFREMSKKGIPENHMLFSSLISSFASVGELKMAEELLYEAEGKKMVRDPSLFLKLVLSYVKEGLMEKTLVVVASMKRVDIRVSDCILCAIVNGFSKKRGFRAAGEVYEDLVAQGCAPGQVTYASVLNIYIRLGQYPKAEKVFSEMEMKGFHNCLVAYSSMIAAYAKMGRTRDAIRLVAKMKERGCEPNVWIYNSLLDMNGRLLNLRQVEKTLKEMKRRKIEPDHVSYTTVISAYNRAREFEMCIKYYEEFKLTGGKIDRAMGGIMVAVLSKMNKVDEVVELLQDMKMQGTTIDARFYKSVTNALRDAGLQVQ